MGLGQKRPAVAKHFALGVQHHIAAIRVHQIWLGIEAGFTGTRSTAAKHIQIAPVLAAIHANRYILGQNFIV